MPNKNRPNRRKDPKGKDWKGYATRAEEEAAKRVEEQAGNMETENEGTDDSSDQGTNNSSPTPNPGARVEGLPGNTETSGGYCGFWSCAFPGMPGPQGSQGSGSPANIIQFPGAGNGTNTWGAGGGGAEEHWGELGVA